MKTQHEILIENPEYRRVFAVESLTAEASELIARLMAEQTLSKADLARKLGKSRSWITQLLSGSTNMTVATLSEVADALNVEIRLHAQPLSGKGTGACSDIYIVRDSTHMSNHSKSRRKPGTSLQPEYAA